MTIRPVTRFLFFVIHKGALHPTFLSLKKERVEFPPLFPLKKVLYVEKGHRKGVARTNHCWLPQGTPFLKKKFLLLMWIKARDKAGLQTNNPTKEKHKEKEKRKKSFFKLLTQDFHQTARSELCHICFYCKKKVFQLCQTSISSWFFWIYFFFGTLLTGHIKKRKNLSWRLQSGR